MNELFGEVISEYTLEQAIEDGFHADFGFMRTSYGLLRIVATTNFLKNTTNLQALSIFFKALKDLRAVKPDMIVFEEDGEEHTEDQERTLITSCAGLTEKVYAKLDNYGNHYVLTLLLASDY